MTMKGDNLDSTRWPLRYLTPKYWAEYVVDHFEAFLPDHAACERKASTMALAFVVQYPDRDRLVMEMIRLAREELRHFHQVAKLIQQRRVSLQPDTKDAYVNALRAQVRTTSDERLLDRLLIFSLIEARGAERFGLISKVLEDRGFREARFYRNLAGSESGHHALFLELARSYFPAPQIDDRYDQYLDIEAEVLRRLPATPSLH